MQLALGLSHLHSRQVVHRDVKPENAFESHRGIYKLGDLGFATLMMGGAHGGASAMQLESGTSDMEGDPRYLSKEVLQAPTACDLTKVCSLLCISPPSSPPLPSLLLTCWMRTISFIEWIGQVDIFALGASLLELAAGAQLPQRGEQWQQLRTHGTC